MTHAELKRRRLALGLSQSRLAQLLDVPSDTLARWERGEQTIRHHRILELALATIERERQPA